MSDVFVSYKAEDRRRVKPLVEALEADGYSVWWDEQIGGGATWRHAIETELNAAKCVLVAWSKRSVGHEGTFVQDEATRAQQRHVYVPVLIDKVHLPLGFGETQALPLTGWKGNRSDAHYQAVLAAVQRIAGDAQGPARSHEKRGLDRRAVIAGGAVATVAVAGVGGWALLRPSTAKASDSIAVLPFANLSGDPAQAYFSDGIAEEIRNALSRLAQLKVVARTSSELVRDMDAKAAAHKLGVANVLTGSVRRSPTTIRVSAQLVDGGDGLERWSATYDRPLGDTLDIQSGIAQSVAQALSIEFGEAEKSALTVGGTNSAEAQDLILQSTVSQLDGTERSLREALQRIDRALALDPNYAEAWARKGLFLGFWAGQFAQNPAQYKTRLDHATAAAKRAIDLAPDYGGGYVVLGAISNLKLDFPHAISNYEHGLSLKGAQPGRAGYIGLLSGLGRANEAWRQLQILEKFDPLSADLPSTRARLLSDARHYREALLELQTMPRNSPAYALQLAQIRLRLGDLDQASQQFAHVPAGNVYRLTGEAIIAAKRGDRAESDRLIARLANENSNTVHYQLAQIYAQRNESDRAFAALDAAWTYRDPGLARLKVDPFIDPLRDDPRFQALVKRMNFPA